MWGLDASTGSFQHEANASLWHKVFGIEESFVADVIRVELQQQLRHYHEEQYAFQHLHVGEKMKNKRLLFLFQKDLMPGMSGQILECKSARDQKAVKEVSLEKKVVAWVLLAVLNLSMLSYIFIFAMSQDPYRQRAWARSFAVWLVVDIVLVSSMVVCCMHVLIPSLTMKDISQIKHKLVESISKYHNAIHQHEEQSPGTKMLTAPKPAFNAADYFFTSSRIAKLYPELKVSQIIAQFVTVWPRQSYQHSTDVSKNYSDKFSGISRSLSLVVMFFLANLLAVPLTIQDMLLQMVATVVTGYTMLLHIQLFHIFPVLVVIPTLFLAAIAHFLYKSHQASQRIQVMSMLQAGGGLKGAESPEGKEELSEEVQEVIDDDVQPINEVLLHPNATHRNRRESVQQGMKMLHQMQREVVVGSHLCDSIISEEDAESASQDDNIIPPSIVQTDDTQNNKATVINRASLSSNDRSSSTDSSVSDVSEEHVSELENSALSEGDISGEDADDSSLQLSEDDNHPVVTNTPDDDQVSLSLSSEEEA